jgi:short-subunit dehydrogenase
MKIEGKTIVLTGATGGIGSTIAKSLAAAGARLILTGRDKVQLDKLNSTLAVADAPHLPLAADLTESSGRQALVAACASCEGGIDILINNAGLSDFCFLEATDSAMISAMLNTNLLAPVLLSRELLPFLRQKDHAVIINIGSTFGGIGYPGFSVYCASKFGLRGFSQALQRELAGSGIEVLYVAPRATKTAINSSRVVEMNRTLGNSMDEPQRIADVICQRIKAERWGSCSIGWPERFFIWLNGVFPGLVSLALQRQLPVIRKFAMQNPIDRYHETERS